MVKHSWKKIVRVDNGKSWLLTHSMVFANHKNQESNTHDLRGSAWDKTTIIEQQWHKPVALRCFGIRITMESHANEAVNSSNHHLPLVSHAAIRLPCSSSWDQGFSCCIATFAGPTVRFNELFQWLKPGNPCNSYLLLLIVVKRSYLSFLLKVIGKLLWITFNLTAYSSSSPGEFWHSNW